MKSNVPQIDCCDVGGKLAALTYGVALRWADSPKGKLAVLKFRLSGGAETMEYALPMQALPEFVAELQALIAEAGCRSDPSTS